MDRMGLPAGVAAKNVIADFRAGIITWEQAVDDIRRIRKAAAAPEEPWPNHQMTIDELLAGGMG